WLRGMGGWPVPQLTALPPRTGKSNQLLLVRFAISGEIAPLQPLLRISGFVIQVFCCQIVASNEQELCAPLFVAGIAIALRRTPTQENRRQPSRGCPGRANLPGTGTPGKVRVSQGWDWS